MAYSTRMNELYEMARANEINCANTNERITRVEEGLGKMHQRLELLANRLDNVIKRVDDRSMEGCASLESFDLNGFPMSSHLDLDARHMFDKMPNSQISQTGIVLSSNLFPVPEFHGINPREWIYQANLYFKNSVEDWNGFEKVKYAYYFMFGPAETWFVETFTTEPKENWECFCDKVLDHFANGFGNVDENIEFMTPKKKGGFKEIEEFKTLEEMPISDVNEKQFLHSNTALPAMSRVELGDENVVGITSGAYTFEMFGANLDNYSNGFMLDRGFEYSVPRASLSREREINSLLEMQYNHRASSSMGSQYSPTMVDRFEYGNLGLSPQSHRGSLLTDDDFGTGFTSDESSYLNRRLLAESLFYGSRNRYISDGKVVLVFNGGVNGDVSVEEGLDVGKLSSPALSDEKELTAKSDYKAIQNFELKVEELQQLQICVIGKNKLELKVKEAQTNEEYLEATLAQKRAEKDSESITHVCQIDENYFRGYIPVDSVKIWNPGINMNSKSRLQPLLDCDDAYLERDYINLFTIESQMQSNEVPWKRIDVATLDMLRFHWWDYSNTGYLDAPKHLTGLKDEVKIKTVDARFILNQQVVAEVMGYDYLIAKDQHGCRFLQRMFEEGTFRDVQKTFSEIVDHMDELKMNPFGNVIWVKNKTGSPVMRINSFAEVSFSDTNHLSLIDDMSETVVQNLSQGSKVMSMDFNPKQETIFLVEINVGEVSIWEAGTRERLVLKPFKVWDILVCLMLFQTTWVKDATIFVNRCIWRLEGAILGFAFSKHIVQIYKYNPAGELRQQQQMSLRNLTTMESSRSADIEPRILGTNDKMKSWKWPDITDSSQLKTLELADPLTASKVLRMLYKQGKNERKYSMYIYLRDAEGLSDFSKRILRQKHDKRELGEEKRSQALRLSNRIWDPGGQFSGVLIEMANCTTQMHLHGHNLGDKVVFKRVALS